MNADELHWVITRQLQEEALTMLFHDEEDSFFVPERGFLGIIHCGNGVRRRMLVLRQIVPQEDGWVGETSDGLSFDPAYFSRALDVVSNSCKGAGILIVHSHFGSKGPVTVPPRPSKPDLYHERRLLFQLTRALPAGSPVASGILTRNGAWRIREYTWPRPTTPQELSSKKFGIDAASYMDASGFRIVSPEMLVVHRYDRPFNYKLSDHKSVDSTLRLWGRSGQELLGNIRVGVAGLGGVGSILVEYLTRIGIGELVLVDFDQVEDENLNRLIGARKDDVGKPKVEYASRIAREAATAKNFNVRVFRESTAEWPGLRALLDTDIILNAADSAFARQVLDHAAYAYAIPLIDGGTKLVVNNAGDVIGKSQVSKAGPGNPCLECSGSYDQEEATLAREDSAMQGPNAYVQAASKEKRKATPRAPSVISFNGLVASLMIQRMLATILGFPPHNKFGQQRYYIEEGMLNWGPTEHCKEGCPKESWIGLADSHPVPVGVDPIWKTMRETSKTNSHNSATG